MGRGRQQQAQKPDIAEDLISGLHERLRDDGSDLSWRAIALYQMVRRDGLPRRTAESYLARYPGQPMMAVVNDWARRQARGRWREWMISTGRSPRAADRWLERDKRSASRVQQARLARFMVDANWQSAASPLIGWRQWDRDPAVYGPLPLAAKVAGRRVLRTSAGVFPVRRTGPGCRVELASGPDGVLEEMVARCIVEPLWVLQARSDAQDHALRDLPLLADEVA